MRIFALLLLLVSSAFAAPPTPDVLTGGVMSASQIRFELQSNLDPWPTSPCTHQPDPQNPFDWNVQCDGDAGKHRFHAHVALTLYPATTQGKNSYELLYWVSDRSKPDTTQHSVTQWIHHEKGTDPIKEYQTGLGVRDDVSSLVLHVRLKR